MKFENFLEQRVHVILQSTDDLKLRAEKLKLPESVVKAQLASTDDYQRQVARLKVSQTMEEGRRARFHAIADGCERESARNRGVTADPFRPYTKAKEKINAAHVADKIEVVDWQVAFDEQTDEVDWLVPDFLEKGKSYALYAAAKEGKSLLLQDVVARMAAGFSVFDREPRPKVRVLYIDMENTIDDVVARMKDYGMTPGDLADLRYLSFPALPALDTEDGGPVLAQLANIHEADLVVIDTLSRVIGGKENDSDTMHGLYRHALMPLKAMGKAVVRLDHAGKDATKGQRGSSAKTTDVDVVWRLDCPDNENVTLIREESRNPHHPEAIRLVREADPLRHVLVGFGKPKPAGLQDMVDMLDKLGVPKTAGRDACRKALSEAGVKVNNETLAAAINDRKHVLDEPFPE